MKLKYIITLTASAAVFTSCEKADNTSSKATNEAASIETAAVEEEFPESERKAIVAEIQAMMMTYNEGSVDLILKKTHPAIHNLVGGQENFEKTTAEGAKQMLDMGIKISSIKIDQPSQFYKAGDEIVCFVPMSSVMTIKDQKIASTSFMIAAKNKKGEWKYLDGTFAGHTPDQLWAFFPELPKDIKLPEVRVEPLP